MVANKNRYTKSTQIRQIRERNEHPDRVKYRTKRSQVNGYLSFVREVRQKHLCIGEYDIYVDLDEAIQKMINLKKEIESK